MNIDDSFAEELGKAVDRETIGIVDHSKLLTRQNH